MLKCKQAVSAVHCGARLVAISKRRMIVFSSSSNLFCLCVQVGVAAFADKVNEHADNDADSELKNRVAAVDLLDQVY